MLSNVLSQFWWMILLRGIVAILFGIMLFVMPGITLLSLIYLFACYVIADGIGLIATALGGRQQHQYWWVLLLAGLAGVIVGILTVMNPGLTALALLFYIAAWAIITGVFQISTAIRLRKEIQGEFWLALGGAASVLFGLLLIARPGAGALAVLTIIGAYAIVFGAILVILALKARGFVNQVRAAARA